MQAALAIPSCHNNPCKASAIHKDKAQLDAALFDPPFCSFAGKQWAAGRVAVRASCESASQSTFRAISRAQAIPQQVVSRENVRHSELPWSDPRVSQGRDTRLVEPKPH